ncbi:MAG: hypothetical protein R2941_03555 [Desulfobacterales bacterium]
MREKITIMHIENENSWMKYAISAWNAAEIGPPDFDPHLILTNPIDFDHSYYKYFEQRYKHMWLEMYSRVNPINGTLLKRESDTFIKLWQRNFSMGNSLKQTHRFLCMGLRLVQKMRLFVEFIMVLFRQAIPSMVIDRILDSNADESFSSDAAFSILFLCKGIFRSMKLPVKIKLRMFL